MSISNVEFVSKLGLICPACGRYEIESTESMQLDDGYCWQGMECNDCEATWQDIYHLASYDNLETKDEGFFNILVK